jgi:hypothetical protein
MTRAILLDMRDIRTLQAINREQLATPTDRLLFSARARRRTRSPAPVTSVSTVSAAAPLSAPPPAPPPRAVRGSHPRLVYRPVPEGSQVRIIPISVPVPPPRFAEGSQAVFVPSAARTAHPAPPARVAPVYAFGARR